MTLGWIPALRHPTMFYRLDTLVRRRARSPHELAMVNLLLFNLLMLVALLAGSFLQKGSPLADYRLLGVLAPLLLSLGLIAHAFFRAAKTAASDHWFVACHWRLATLRYRILLIAYGVGAALIGLGWVISRAQAGPAMQELMFVALQRVAIAPMLICLMVLIMLESGSLHQADQGEIPDRLARGFPPPPDLEPCENGTLNSD